MDALTALHDLMANKCQCGKPKKSGHSLCHGCFLDLPDGMRRSLYKRMGCGYEEAYGKAVAFLFNHNVTRRIG